MKLYTNITTFMENNWISYQDRIVLQTIISCIKKGFYIIPFIYQNSFCQIVNRQLFAEYFFTKTLTSKHKYKNYDEFKLSEISNDDIYFEINISDTSINHKKYYETIKQTGCKMYSFLPFGTDLFTLNGKKKNQKNCLYMYLNYMEKIWLTDKSIQHQIEEKYPTCKTLIETCSFDCIADVNNNDRFIEIDKGLLNIIQMKNYVVYLPDYDDIFSNRVRIEEIEKIYPEKKIIIILMTCKNIETFLSYIYHQSHFGEKIFLALDVDYYTILNLYASAETVIIPKQCCICAFEITHIQKMGGNYILL